MAKSVNPSAKKKASRRPGAKRRASVKPAPKEEAAAEPEAETEAGATSPEQSDEQAKVKKTSSDDGETASEDEILRKVSGRIRKYGEFPALSQYISEVNDLLAEDTASAQELANVILKDQALTTKLLKIANSPIYATISGRINTISHAVVMLGFEAVRQTALSLMLVDQLKTNDPAQADVFEEAAITALLSGIVAKNLAQNVGTVAQEEAFVCGMLNRLGKRIAILYFPDELEKIEKAVAARTMSARQAATQMLGAPLDVIGQVMAKHWKFPKRIRNSMAWLRPGILPKPKTKDQQLHHIAAFASEIIDLAETAHPKKLQRRATILSERFGRSVQLGERELRTLFRTVVMQTKDYGSVLNLDVAQTTVVQTVMAATGADVDPKTIEIRVRKRVHLARKRVKLRALAEKDSLDTIAADLVRDVSDLDSDDQVDDALQSGLATKLKEEKIPVGADFAIQAVQDADDFIIPETVEHRNAKAIGLAAVSTEDEIGRPAITVLLVVAGNFGDPPPD